MKNVLTRLSIAAVILLGPTLGMSSMDQMFIKEAQALMATPANVAEIARQSALKNVYRDVVIGQKVTALPVGYTKVEIKGETYYVHNNNYLKAYYEGNRVVYVVVEKP